MTIIQASICNSGETLVLIGDRMITTMGSYETEGKSPKLYQFGKYAMGFAGSLADIIGLKDLIRDEYEKNPHMNFDDFIKMIVTTFAEENDRRLRRFVETYTLVSYDAFKKIVENGESSMPADTIDWIYAKWENKVLACDAIVIGFDEKKVPKIIEIDSELNISCHSDQFNHAIGSGKLFSMIYFDTRGYESKCTKNYGIFFSYQAKKSAEAHIGVGEQTDIIIIDQDGRNVMVKNDSNEMKELKGLYRECQEEIEKKYDEYASKIKEV
jgi:20S proteasome alpha/beta subunit